MKKSDKTHEDSIINHLAALLEATVQKTQEEKEKLKSMQEEYRNNAQKILTLFEKNLEKSEIERTPYINHPLIPDIRTAEAISEKIDNFVVHTNNELIYIRLIYLRRMLTPFMGSTSVISLSPIHIQTAPIAAIVEEENTPPFTQLFISNYKLTQKIHEILTYAYTILNLTLILKNYYNNDKAKKEQLSKVERATLIEIADTYAYEHILLPEYHAAVAMMYNKIIKQENLNLPEVNIESFIAKDQQGQHFIISADDYAKIN
jgi:hypothetical protein